MIYLIIFYLGAIIGSFIGVVAYRLPLDKPIIMSQSMCTSCNTNLSAYELIPIFSFLLQGARCRTCKEKIDSRIFYVEIINAFIFLILFLNLKLGMEYLLGIIISEILFLIALIDLDHKIIPNKLSFLVIGISVLKVVFESVFIRRLIISMIYSLVVYFLYKFTDEAFGMGDIKVFYGLIFFWPIDRFFLNLLLSLIVASIYSLYQILYKDLNKKDSIAFGPFIFIGFILTLTLGDILMNVYFKIMM